jgi:hypothetical protein
MLVAAVLFVRRNRHRRRSCEQHRAETATADVRGWTAPMAEPPPETMAFQQLVPTQMAAMRGQIDSLEAGELTHHLLGLLPLEHGEPLVRASSALHAAAWNIWYLYSTCCVTILDNINVALCCSIGTWSAPMPTRRTPVRGHESCPCSCRLLPASIRLDDNQLNASRTSHRAARNPQTHPNARNTRRAHHPGSTGDSGEIEGAI